MSIPENYFKSDAKAIVDMCFDAKIFVDSITRDDLNSTEEFIKDMLQSRFESYIRIKDLTKRMSDKE